MTVKCPKCKSTSVSHEHTMVDRNFTMCYVDYYKCKDCGNVWEPQRTIDLPLDRNLDLKVPDGSRIRVVFPDGETWEKSLRVLDSTHFCLDNGCSWHIGQFRGLMMDNPGTKVEIINSNKKKCTGKGCGCKGNCNKCKKTKKVQKNKNLKQVPKKITWKKV